MVNDQSAPMPLVTPCCGAPVYIGEDMNRQTGYYEPSSIECLGDGCFNYWTSGGEIDIW